MNHDEFCPFKEYPNIQQCERCEIIEKVRIDERKREAERRAKEFGVWHDDQRSLP